MCVYFITCRDVDCVKIGYAINPVARYRHLQTSCPLELALEGAIPGGFEKEQQLHRLYAKWRVRGEWFTITPSIEDAIAESTRPEKYTWAAVRTWIKTLEREHEIVIEETELESRRAAREQTMRRVQQDMALKAHLSRMPALRKLEVLGEIHFPFRVKETA